MIEIYIEHNPYKPFTKILIDNEPVKDNSSLNYKNRPFQEWVEGLPATLRDECADDEFHITFHGTILDFEDLQSVALAAENDGIKITCIHEPAKEVKDKEAAIDAIFQEIAENQYFEELKSPDMLKAFEIAKGKEFPVNVIATMSSGKSTLINALLGQKLMPAMQEACTATITELHDDDGDHFVATAYDANNLKLSFIDPLNLSAMEVLNKDSKVSKVVAQGNIPFVSSEDVSLVLVDTPGPNNARNDEHRAATFRMLSESSKPLVLYVLNATQLAINDDNALLTEVAESMKVGGKQSKDRYIFQEKGHWRSVYEDREFVEGQKLADAFFAPVQENLYQNQTDINESTKKQVNKIKKEFKERFDELDRALKKKLAELEQCASDENAQDEIIRQTTERLNWLTDIQNRVNAILEI